MRPLEATLLTSAVDPGGFPRGGLPEVAFLGRSNVGKSSLLNRLAGRRGLARTSNTPGKTRLIHFFRVRSADAEILLVDLPGYGWARVSQRERLGWKRMVEGYLEGRAALRAAVLLQDLRRDPSGDEFDLLAWLDERGIPALFALTKADKLPPMRRGRRVRELLPQLPLPPERVIVTSAQQGIGIPELWRTLGTFLGS